MIAVARFRIREYVLLAVSMSGFRYEMQRKRECLDDQPAAGIDVEVDLAPLRNPAATDRRQHEFVLAVFADFDGHRL